jgi:hypothetical protein
MLTLASALVLFFAVRAITRGHVSDTVILIIAAAIMATGYLAGGRWIERRQPTEFMGAGGITEFGSGIGLVFLLFSVVMGLLLAIVRSGRVQPPAWSPSPRAAKTAVDSAS